MDNKETAFNIVYHWKNTSTNVSREYNLRNLVELITEALDKAVYQPSTIEEKLDIIIARLGIIETLGARSRVTPAGEHTLTPIPGARPLATSDDLARAYHAANPDANFANPPADKNRRSSQ